MVQPLLEIIATDKQQQKWLPLLKSYRCIGAYAQTELGHGSDVQSLETIATYDVNNNCFYLNSPNISSYKWWPGELGVFCNIAIVYAKTLIDKQSVGVFPFIMELRNFESHELYENIEVGDIGPKLGCNGKDNGFMKFNNFRISGDSLLSRFFFIKDNRMVKRGNPKIIYVAMMRVRISILICGAFQLGKALSITLRYSNLRKQFKNSNGIQIPIINYQVQQHKLFPLLAKAYIIQTTYLQIDKKINKLNKNIRKGNFDDLQECHLILCASKSVFTQWVLDGLITSIQCCGGAWFFKF